MTLHAKTTPKLKEKKIKVLRIINRFNIGGPTFNATFLTRFLSDEYETLLLGGLSEEDEKDSLHITEMYDVHPVLITEMKRTPSIINDYKAYKKICQIIKEFNPDIVHTHASKAGAIGRRAAVKCKVPVIVHTFHGHVFHSYFGKTKTKIFKTIESRLAKKSTAIIAISEQQKIELSKMHKICADDKISVVPLGFDLLPFYTNKEQNRAIVRERFCIEDDTIAIAIIGRLAPIKNHQLFLDSMGIVLSKTNKKVKIFIVGDGSERSFIEKHVEQLNKKHSNAILMTSWITNIAEFNAGMDLICLTSKNEGTPVSLIEAQAAGVPVITTNVGGVKDIVCHGETGFIVEEQDPKIFANYVLQLLEDEKKRKNMSQNGLSFVRERYHYQRLVEDMDKLYKDLLKKVK